MTLFSIVLPAYNCGGKLEKTVASVLSQREDLFELIVVDGGSTDGTLDAIKKQGTRLKWISEKDAGIYDAMNKGIDMASGKFLYFLGAGDCLREGILNTLEKHMPGDDSAFVYGNVYMIHLGKNHDGRFGKAKLALGNICHQAIFYGRGVFDRLGRYDLRYNLLADYAFNIRCFCEDGIRKKYVDYVVADYEGAGASIQRPDVNFFHDRPRLVKSLGMGPYLLYRLYLSLPSPLLQALIRVRRQARLLTASPRERG